MGASGRTPVGELQPRITADGSPTLWSETFGECFHSGAGARAEAQGKFVQPAQLERYPAGSQLRVLDVCVGLGYNSAALLEAAADRQLRIDWIGLELDPRPLGLALAEPAFRGLWRSTTLTALEQLHRDGRWSLPAAVAEGDGAASAGVWLLGDARSQLKAVRRRWQGRCDLVLLDAFSPGHCPELWTVEFLGALAGLLHPRGRLLTYCGAAAVRTALRLAGLELASIVPAPVPRADGERGETRGSGDDGPGPPRHLWCAGTAASPTPLTGAEPADGRAAGVLRPLDAMELEHLLSRAGEPYRDPDGSADGATIRRRRAERQLLHPGESSGAWRRRWGLAR